MTTRPRPAANVPADAAQSAQDARKGRKQGIIQDDGVKGLDVSGQSNIGRRILDAATTEREWLVSVTQLAHRLGYLTYHTELSRGSNRGFPDLCCVDPERGRIVFLELKTEKGKLTPMQETWILALSAINGVSVMVARPSQWGDVVAILEGR